MPLILFEKSKTNVGTITLNDPDNLNAMGEAMAEEFVTLISSLQGDKTLRAVIITGAGRAFSAGGNLEMLDKKRSIPAEENRLIMLNFYHSFLSIRKLGVPVIAAINGHAVGAGLCLAAACDIRVASENAKIGVTFTKLGLHPGMGGTYFLPQILGPAMAAELMITGRMIEAPEALRIGLVSSLTPAGAAVGRAEEIAAEIVLCGPESVRQLLESLRTNTRSLPEALEREALCQSVNYQSKEFAEGVAAAREKRKAAF